MTISPSRSTKYNPLQITSYDIILLITQEEQEFADGDDEEIAMACNMGMLEDEEVADGDAVVVPKERGLWFHWGTER